MSTSRRLPERLTLTAVSDPWLVDHGHPATGRYVEHFWLPVVGPTAVAVLRQGHFLLGLAQQPTTTVASGDLAVAVGLGRSAGTLARTLERLHWHRLAHYRDGRIELPTHVPPLPRHEHHKLSPWLGASAPTVQPPATPLACSTPPPPPVTLAADLKAGQIINLAGRSLSVRSSTLTGGRVITELQHLGGDHDGLIVELDWDPGEAIRLHRPAAAKPCFAPPPGLDL